MGLFGKKTQAEARPLKIFIVGGGKVGVTLVDQLSSEGNDITIIDNDATVVSDITNEYDVIGFVGNGASYSVQKEAGIDGCDLFIAVTGSDELNLLCCTVATRVGNCSAIARVRTPDYSKEINYLRDRLELAMIINPEFEAATEIAKSLYLPSALEVNTFAHGGAVMTRFKLTPDSKLCGKTVAEINHSTSERFLFTSMIRDGKAFIPNGSTTFEVGDHVSFISRRTKSRTILTELGIPTPTVRDVMIIGGGKAAYYLAEQLLRENIEVKIIEWDKKRCEELSILLPDAIIINGDGTDEALLSEAGIKSVGAFVALTGIDEENILLTMHARSISQTKVITKVNRFAFQDVIDSLELGTVVYPRIITSEYILAFARAKRASVDSNIETLYHLCDGQVEAIEFKIETSSALTDTPLKRLRLKSGVMVTFIARNGQIIFPTGDDSIKVGDSFMIITTHRGFGEATDILN